MPIYLPQLSAHDVSFPPLARALTEPDGLLAMGGDLSPERLLNAYSQAIFPWFSEDDPILWWSPSVRALFPPDTLSLNRTLKKLLRRHQLSFSINTAFTSVIKQCSAPRAKQPGTWILPQMQQAYIKLNQLGYAHSVEVWHQQQLVGGLYGILVGEMFCGESMFNLMPDMAKLALVALQQHLQCVASGWIDCQMPNPFLLQLGATAMPRVDYVVLLEQCKGRTLPQTHWQPQHFELKP